MSEENPQPLKKTRGHRFGVLEGQTLQAGKSKYPDFMRMEIPRAEALSFALEILRQLERSLVEEKPLLSVPVFGRLERVTEDDL